MLSSALKPATPATVRSAYLSELTAGIEHPTLLLGRWVEERAFSEMLSMGLIDLKAVQPDATGHEPLGLLGINRVNLTMGAGYLVYSTYRESILFWPALVEYLSTVFQRVALRRIYIETVAGSSEMTTSLGEAGAVHCLTFHAHSFRNGHFADIELWALDRGSTQSFEVL